MLKKNINLTTFLLSFVAVVLLSCLQKVRCDGIVQVKLLNYTNPGGKKDTGTCCDPLVFGTCEPNGGCDTQFYVGIDDVSNPARDNYTAFKYGFVKTGYTADSSSIDYHLLTDLGRGVVNPITYNFTSSWPGQVMMKVQAWDHELVIGDAEKIDFMQSALTLSPALAANRNSAPWTTTRIQNRTTMWMNVRVFCGANWYGDQCNVLCISGNRYTCGADGSKICSGGWTGSDCNTYDGAGQVTAANSGQEVSDPVLVTDAGSDQVTDASSDQVTTAAAANDCGGGCQNSGLCIGGSCSCRSGFTGGNCEADIDECASVDCHGGTCIDGINRFTCQCPIGLTGDTCEVVEEGCGNDPCRNGGTCQVISNAVYCSCATGWTGSRCNADIDECSTKMCRNSIGCLNTDGAFVCTCQFGWIGPLCDVKINLVTSRFSKRSVWTFRGKLSDDEILRIVNRIIILIARSGSGGSQSTSSVLVYYEVRFLSSESSREAKTILFLRVNGGGEPIPVETLTTLANGPSKSEISSSLMSAEDDNGDSTARNLMLSTSRTSQGSVWTLRGTLSDDEILLILNRVINAVTATGAGGSQSTSSVLVYYEVRFFNSESPQEAKTILLLRVNSGGNRIPMGTLTALANGPSKSEISPSLMSAEDDDRDITATNLTLSTSRISKISVWTFQGKLSDDDILRILNLVITRITSTGSGGSQSTSSVIVYYEVRFLNSESPGEAKTILLLRVNSGGEPIPMETLTALANGPSKSELSSSLMSAEDGNEVNTARDISLSTSRISKRSAWTFGGKLSDNEIMGILNRVITTVTSIGSGGSQSTKSVLVDYEVRYVNSESPREAKTILLLRLNSGGKPVPMETLTALANGPSKSLLYSSLMSAETDNGDSDLMIVTSKRSVWTFQGKLSDAEIVDILNLVITKITATGSGGNQSTSSVIVYYKFRYLNSESPRDSKTILLLRVNRGGEPIPMETLTALANGPSKSEISSSLLSAEDDNGVNTEGETQGQTQLQLEPSELERRLDIGAIIVISFIIIGVIIGIILVCIRKPRQRWEFETQQKDPFEMPEATKEQSFEEGECGGLGTGEQDNDRYTTDGSDLQPTAPNIYVIKGHGHDQKGQNKGSSSSSSSKNSSYVNVPADVKRKK